MIPSCSSPARRQSAFPLCATEALEQVTKFCAQQSQKWRGPAAIRNNELQHLLDNDLFCISSHRRGTRLKPIQQFQLIRLLCVYFNMIFCGREGEALLHDIRITVLINLCSLAVQYPCYSLLNHVSQWLHKIGSGKSYAQQIINLLVEHFIQSPLEWNLHRHLLPLANEAPEFVSYFVAYSVNERTIRSSLIEILTYWLTGTQANRIITFIKETPSINKYFANNTFWYLVLYDCTSGYSGHSPLHGLTTMLYADWVKTPALNIKPALEAIVSSNDKDLKLEPIVLYYHLHFARLSNYLSKKDVNDFLGRIHLTEDYEAQFESLK